MTARFDNPQLASRIRELRHQGLKVLDICNELHVATRTCYRALTGNDYADRTNTAHLEGAPCLPDEIASRLSEKCDPEDEEATAELVYQAAAEIRQRAPRDPVGYRTSEIMLHKLWIPQ